MPLLESMLLSLLLTPVEIGPSNASPGQQRKKERNGTNKKYDTRQDLNPGPSTYRALALPTELRYQLVEPEFNPYKLYTSSNHSAAISPSCGLFERHISFC